MKVIVGQLDPQTTEMPQPLLRPTPSHTHMRQRDMLGTTVLQHLPPSGTNSGIAPDQTRRANNAVHPPSTTVHHAVWMHAWAHTTAANSTLSSFKSMRTCQELQGDSAACMHAHLVGHAEDVRVVLLEPTHAGEAVQSA